MIMLSAAHCPRVTFEYSGEGRAPSNLVSYRLSAEYTFSYPREGEASTKFYARNDSFNPTETISLSELGSNSI